MSEEKTKRPWYRYILNKFLIVGIFFVVWMTFFDQNSYLLHQALDQDIEELTEEITYFENEIEHEEDELNRLKEHPEEYERLAREKFLMKKANEDIFVIESIDTTSHE